METLEGKEINKGTEIFEIYFKYMPGDFSQINVRHWTKDPESSENTKQDKCRKTRSRHTISNYRNKI